MTLPTRGALALLAVPAIVLAWAGCNGIVATETEYTPVYGDYGYVGPWDGSRVDVEGGYIVAPPYGAPDHDRRDEDRRRQEAPPPERGRAPEHQPAEAPRPGPEPRRAPESHPAPAPHPVQAPHAAPAPRAPSRPIPSIPNNPRPSPQGGGNARNKR